jgi:hypothetical protein
MNEFVSNNIITIIAVVLIFEVLSGMLAQRLAEKKGHSKRWFWAGFLLSLAGAVWAAGLPDEALRQRLEEENAKRRKPAPTVAPTAHLAENKRVRDEKKLVAVLSAAVAAAGESEGKRFVMRSFRPAGEGSTAWNRAGRGRGRPPPSRG